MVSRMKRRRFRRRRSSLSRRLAKTTATALISGANAHRPISERVYSMEPNLNPETPVPASQAMESDQRLIAKDSAVVQEPINIGNLASRTEFNPDTQDGDFITWNVKLATNKKIRKDILCGKKSCVQVCSEHISGGEMHADDFVLHTTDEDQKTTHYNYFELKDKASEKLNEKPDDHHVDDCSGWSWNQRACFKDRKKKLSPNLWMSVFKSTQAKCFCGIQSIYDKIRYTKYECTGSAFERTQTPAYIEVDKNKSAYIIDIQFTTFPTATANFEAISKSEKVYAYNHKSAVETSED